jgi:tetratricopeptide (TPR) repeat protein
VRPDSPYVYFGLGVVHGGARQFAEAEACYRRSIELDPNNAAVHSNLGLVLDELNKPDEAIAQFLKAIEIDPRHANAHINLGAIYMARQQFDKAVDCFQAAIEIQPESDAAYNNLGTALRSQGKLDEATRTFRAALKINANNPMAWCNLGHALRQQGNLAEALDAFTKGHEIGSGRPDWNYPSGEWIKETKAQVALDAKLALVLTGEAAPASPVERADMAELCLTHRERYVMAARYFTEAFAGNPILTLFPGGQRRFNAARAAALAAAGKGVDAGQLDDKERARWRAQALEWLKADLAAWTHALDNNPARTRAPLQSSLESWQNHAQLVSVRDTEALAKLPATERAAWEKLWIEVERLLRRARESK